MFLSGEKAAEFVKAREAEAEAARVEARQRGAMGSWPHFEVDEFEVD